MICQQCGCKHYDEDPAERGRIQRIAEEIEADE